jgi:hypothetical protein
MIALSREDVAVNKGKIQNRMTSTVLSSYQGGTGKPLAMIVFGNKRAQHVEAIANPLATPSQSARCVRSGLGLVITDQVVINANNSVTVV